MRPALGRPPPGIVVAAGVDERDVLRRWIPAPLSIQYAGVWTWRAGRSLSSAHGSTSVPIVNAPAGTSTSAGRSVSRAGSRRLGVQCGRTRRATGAWRASSRRAAARAGRSCRTQSPDRRGVGPRAVSVRARRAPCRAPCRHTNAPRTGRAAATRAGRAAGAGTRRRGRSMSARTGSRPPTSRTSQSSSWLPMCA